MPRRNEREKRLKADLKLKIQKTYKGKKPEIFIGSKKHSEEKIGLSAWKTFKGRRAQNMTKAKIARIISQG